MSGFSIILPISFDSLKKINVGVYTRFSFAALPSGSFLLRSTAINSIFSSFIPITLNIFSALGMIPTKGMTLPFVSYGGSSMLATSILFGFLLSLTNINNEEE